MKMKNILVTGANGQLGNEMRVLSLENKEYNYFFTDVAELDICDEKAVMAFVKENEIDVIVNCAAYTAVDKAEDNQELCAKLNSEAVGYFCRFPISLQIIYFRNIDIIFQYIILFIFTCGNKNNFNIFTSTFYFLNKT